MKTGPQFPQELRVGPRESPSTERIIQACLDAHINSKILRDLKMLRNHRETDDRHVLGLTLLSRRRATSGETVGPGTSGAARIGTWTTSSTSQKERSKEIRTGKVLSHGW